jgi:hypothetical protein
MNVDQRIDETALALSVLSEEDRNRAFVEAFDQVLVRRPDLKEIPPEIIAYMAAVYRRIAEFELTGGTA